MKNVVWEAANILDMDTILSMADDGYEFVIGDGKISYIIMDLPLAA